MSNVGDDEATDLRVVEDDGLTVTVEVMQDGVSRVAYGVPKRTLGVLFTPQGVEPRQTPRIQTNHGVVYEKVPVLVDRSARNLTLLKRAQRRFNKT